ncbi:hypothetical protein ACFLVX_02590 [Chloroflexota bacterium]
MSEDALFRATTRLSRCCKARHSVDSVLMPVKQKESCSKDSTGLIAVEEERPL